MDSYSGHTSFNLHMVRARFNFVLTNLRVKKPTHDKSARHYLLKRKSEQTHSF